MIFFDYTTKKKTLIAELERLGWKLKRTQNQKTVKSTQGLKISDIIKQRKDVEDIFNNQEIKTQNFPYISQISNQLRT